MTLATSRQMLVRLGFSESAVNYIYHCQGIDYINEWTNFDKNGVVYLLHSAHNTRWQQKW